MFQNISIEDADEREDAKEEERVNKIQKWKKLFGIRNCIIYLLSFFISTVSLGNFIAPFGLAMFAAACSNEIPAGIIYIASAIGVVVGFGKESLLSFILTSLIFMFAVLLFKPNIEDSTRNEKRKLGLHLFFSYLLVQVMGLFLGRFYLYDVLSAIAISLIAYIFYKIFSNSLTFIKEYGEKTVFTVEEVMAVSVLFTIAFSAFGDFEIANFSIKNIACILMVLVLGWKNGILVGGTAGVTIGVLLGIIGGENIALIGAYAVSRNDSRFIKPFWKNRSYYRLCIRKCCFDLCD